MRLFGTVDKIIYGTDAAAWMWPPFDLVLLVASQYHASAAQVFTPGTDAGQVFAPGSTAAQVFKPGMVAGEVE